MEKGISSRASSESYEVFLSFRGSDTRHTFTDFLYHGMVEAGIIVFRDNESLHFGEKTGKLLHAIENSKIYIPIFSKNYASSDWCLRELAHMVECTSKSNGNKEILPIFLDVVPDDVKLKTKLYVKDLQKRRTCSEVRSWRQALIEVGRIIGWNWAINKGQVDLIKSVIQHVQNKLNAECKKIVTEDLVGVDDHVEAIIKMLDVGSDSIQFLGIYGIGGIGKTTLAKVVFNQLSSHFRDRNFLLDIRELSKRHGLLYLQKQLLLKYSDICPNLDKIQDTDDGINMIKRVLGNRKVLIVLDDVDEEVQLKSLVANGDCFGSGSRIIITTRDQNVLSIEGEAIGKDPAKKSAKVLTYEVLEMKFDDALKFLSRRAFGSYSPPDQYLLLAREVVSTLGNLPLALEVIGSSLKYAPKEYWEAILQKLKDAPPYDVQRKLMISYDKLDYEKKQVFLDIACFFVNGDKTYPFYMWDACGYHPHIAIKGLCQMSLIKIKDDNTFWMQDQVRGLGRDIVHRENHENPCKRSRVWKLEDALSILNREKGSKKLEALSVRFQGLLDEGIIIKHNEFANLRNLRFFYGVQVSFDGDFNNFLSRLRWLSYRYSSSLFEAKNFHPTNLVVLDLSWSTISEESIDWIKAARNLKVLDLSSCDNLRRTPDLSMLVFLEILRLRYCRKIKKLPDSIGNLQSLLELDLTGTGIDDLPDSFSNLKQLTTLRMRDIEGGMTKLPSATWLVQLAANPFWSHGINLTLSGLKMPDLSWTQISRLPTVASLVSNIHKLEVAAQDCRRILDPTWTALHELENVFVFPTELGPTQSQVEKLILASPNMQFLLQLPPSLRELVFRELAIIHDTHLFSFWMPIFLGICDSELEKLHMQDCTLSRRLALFMSKMERSTPPRPLPDELPTKALAPSHMKNLQEVDLFECEQLVEIHSLEELGSLCSLAVVYCRSIERMPDLSKSRKLRELKVGKCPKLRSVEGLDRLESLKCLQIHDCKSLESLADTSNLDLECLQIVRCKRLPNHCSYCKHGWSCYCDMLFEGLWKSDLEVQQILQGHPDVAPIRNSEHGLIVVLGVAILFVLLLVWFFVF